MSEGAPLGVPFLFAAGYDQTMRLFAALRLPDEVSAYLAEWRRQIAPALPESQWRMVPSRLWHLTLAFYGEVKGGSVDDLAEQLAQCAAQAPLLSLQTAGFGVFPRPMRPRVCWIGVSELGGGRSMKRLAHCCRRAGHATVRQQQAGASPFRAHITIARSTAAVRPFDPERVMQLAQLPVIEWQAARLTLMQSILSSHGPDYRPLESFAFGVDASTAPVLKRS